MLFIGCSLNWPKTKTCNSNKLYKGKCKKIQEEGEEEKEKVDEEDKKTSVCQIKIILIEA